MRAFFQLLRNFKLYGSDHLGLVKVRTAEQSALICEERADKLMVDSVLLCCSMEAKFSA